MRITDYSTLTFDCYGTLIDWERGIVAELRPWVAGRQPALSEGELLEAFGNTESAVQAEFPQLAYPQVLERVHQRLGALWGIAPDPARSVDFGESIGRWPAFPDSPGALRSLERHFRLVILSNVDRASFARSNERLGVEFDRICTAQDIGSYKPDLRNFRYLLDRLAEDGTERGRVLHVAQSLFHDILPARAVGLATVWVNRRRGSPGWGATPPPAGEVAPDAEVASLAELAEWHRREAPG